MFKSQPRQTEVVKTGSDKSIAKRSATGVSVTGPRDDHYKRMPRVTVAVVRLRTLTAQVPSIGQNLKPLTGNGDVSI